MKNRRYVLLTMTIMTFMGNSLSAQDAEFNFSSQRSEAQDVLMVPGKKIDHKGIIINPTPQTLKVDEHNKINLFAGIKLTDKKNVFANDMNFIQKSKKGISVTVDFGSKLAAKHNVKNVSGAYILEINKKGITIIGYDERGAFYGIQSLKQLVESEISINGNLPYLYINDYPDLPYRGVVEGFYGTPWSHSVRLSLIDFYGKYKMNSYLYGPKDDPYHSCPNWRLPYPEKEAENIKQLVAACGKNRVDFVWAIHPGQDIKWNEEDYMNLVNKFNMMYSLGVRSFAIFFDDIDGEGTNPLRQTELLNRLNKEFVKNKGDVTSLVVCPTDYSKLWADPTPQGSLSIYGKTLDPSIQIFWTGDAVCSDLTKSTMEWLNSRTKRPGYYWWNYPVTDYVRHIIMQGPVYGLDTSLTASELCGLASNPMEHGEASKLALYGVADYSWNVSQYNPIDNWERGLEVITPEAKNAYRTFAIHSCDTETGYRRSESWETETFRISNYTQKQFDALKKEFEKIENTPNEFEGKCTNKALISELHPWLVEFGKLGNRGKKTLDLIKFKEKGNEAEFWSAYVANLMSDDDKKAYSAHKSGTMKLQPFYENAMDDLITQFYFDITGDVPTSYKGIGSFNNLSTPLAKLMLDNDTTTFYTSGKGQDAGDWIGVYLGCVRIVSEIEILQGRNSTDDVDYFDNVILEYSKDGKSWKALTDSLKKQYVITWTGKPIEASYIRLKRLDSDKKNWAAVRSFKVNPIRSSDLPFVVKSENIDKALLGFDKNPETSFVNNGVLLFGIPVNATKCTLLLKPLIAGDSKIEIRQLRKNGSVLNRITSDSAFVKFDIVKDATTIEVDGNVEIFEIVMN